MPGLHVTIDPNNPISVAMCDRCKFQWNRTALQWQYDWRGNSLVNLRQLVCPYCLDEPQEQLRNPQLTADPIPVRDPRPDTKNDTYNIQSETPENLLTDTDFAIDTEN
jgi:hypothetical protein